MQKDQNSTADHRDKEEWWTLVRAYARSQLDYPAGVGLSKSVQIKRMVVGEIPLWQVSPKKLQVIINRLRNEWKRLNERQIPS